MIYWDVHTQPSLRATENDMLKKISGSLDKNVRGERMATLAYGDIKATVTQVTSD